jgi:alpha-D-ribose 1-methylphosphonate 5-triphosphate synthase subunit PhnH
MKPKHMERDIHFRTSQFPLAAFLYTKNHQVAGINFTDEPGRKEFAFVVTPELEQLVEKFKYGSRSDPDLLVEVHAYEQARRDLLDRLNDR